MFLSAWEECVFYYCLVESSAYWSPLHLQCCSHPVLTDLLPECSTCYWESAVLESPTTLPFVSFLCRSVNICFMYLCVLDSGCIYNCSTSCWVDSYYIMTFFVSSDNFWLKVYLVWYKYGTYLLSFGYQFYVISLPIPYLIWLDI